MMCIRPQRPKQMEPAIVFDYAPGTAGSAPSSPANSPRPRTKPKYDPLYLTKVFIFAVLWIAIPFATVVVGATILPFEIITQKRTLIREVQKAFGSFVVVTVYLFLPQTELVLTGDWPHLEATKKTIAIANHQIYPDWINLHGDLRIILIKVLSLLPILGQGIQLFDWIFVHQKLDKDREIIRQNLTTAKNDVGNPLFLLIFPEGTLNTPGNVEKSKLYAEKMRISPHPQHVILPKSTGLYLALQDLSPSVDNLFDLTVGYSGVSSTDVPFAVFPPDKLFFEDRYPSEIHIHVTKYSVRDLPGFRATDEVSSNDEGLKKEFDTWLRSVWMEKDNRLKYFYDYGWMVDTLKSVDGVTYVKVVPKLLDWLYFWGLLFIAWIVIPIYGQIIWWALWAICYGFYYTISRAFSL
ncbi:hypothetical protein BCR33DRAFT_854843 [Rhizoclosmatium globosum]|uniref:Phospholipid/glycerol acyltransferase domain-containing protein n=1 Tax=Rhizoclosmatium globosum TaxID=329046 RepID=A0A1Y2BRL1_9FUNG|nr:hypothetical protein BCR33DRAFT_854843 [Rhizoclosmatium globosum]|eukprot:ORY37267.1 hypothetical protein BCR33DRAFT_854843 [Rhizoclosmatium globosum]